MTQKNRIRWDQIDWINILFFVATPLASFILVPLYFREHDWSWTLPFQTILFWAITSFSITGGYHRHFSHLSYSTNKFVRLMFLLFGAASFQGSALRWCSDHRRHHRFVDTDVDPYSIKKGFWWAHMGWLFVKTEEKYLNDVPSDLKNDPLIAWQDKNYTLIAIVMGFGFPMLVGGLLGSVFGGLVFGAVIRIVITHHCTFFINSLCHTFGRQPYSSEHSAKDSFVMAVLTYGEGYHNFHHQFQFDYRNGVRWWQWDPTKWSIRLMSFVGMARKLKTVSAETILKARIQQDEKSLVSRGVSAERLQAMKLKIEEAQVRFKAMKQEYQQLKSGFQKRSSEKYHYLKAEMKVAKLEFKAAHAQWKAYKRALQSI